MSAQIVLGKITAAARNFANLRETAGGQFQPCAHRIAVTLGPNKFEGYEASSGQAGVVHQQWRVPVVGDNHVDKAIVIEIRECHTTAGMRRRKSAARYLCHVQEFSMTVVVK